MKIPQSTAVNLRWLDTTRTQLSPEIWSVQLRTNAGTISTLFHPSIAQTSRAGVVWVGGVGGGLDGPARGLYPEACQRLQTTGVSGLRLDYRLPGDLPTSVADTLLGVAFLNSEGCDRIALVGHSFGGAVVIEAGTRSEFVKAVVPMSTQSYGTGRVQKISPRPILIIHGTADEILSDLCSRDVFSRALEPKELRLFPGAHHGLDEVRDELLDLLVGWIPTALG